MNIINKLIFFINNKEEFFNNIISTEYYNKIIKIILFIKA